MTDSATGAIRIDLDSGEDAYLESLHAAQDAVSERVVTEISQHIAGARLKELAQLITKSVEIELERLTAEGVLVSSPVLAGEPWYVARVELEGSDAQVRFWYNITGAREICSTSVCLSLPLAVVH